MRNIGHSHMTTNETKVEDNSNVTMHFRMKLENDFVIEDTFDDEPYSFTIGDGSVVSGIENALIGLAQSEKKHIVLQPQDAFGFASDENITKMPIKDFPDSLKIEKGNVVGFSTPSGEDVPGTILEIGEDEITVDFNHPLSSQVIIVDVEILSVEPSD